MLASVSPEPNGLEPGSVADWLREVDFTVFAAHTVTRGVSVEPRSADRISIFGCQLLRLKGKVHAFLLDAAMVLLVGAFAGGKKPDWGAWC